MREIWRQNCDQLEQWQQEELWKVLSDFTDILQTDNEVGLTHLVQHEIDTGGPRPIKTHPQPLPMAHREAAKRSTKMRFCMDYRPLNSVTRKDLYPLPRIDESLVLVSGSSWFSSLDLRSGYWQVPLSPEARPKTAFCMDRGLWQFRVLRFGLCNAQATFEKWTGCWLASPVRDVWCIG